MTKYTTLSLTASVKSLVFILSILGMSTFGYNQQIQLNLSSGETQKLEVSQVRGMKVTGQGTIHLISSSQGVQITESLVLGNQVKLICDEVIQLVGSGVLQAPQLKSDIYIQGDWELSSDLNLKADKEAHFHNTTFNLGNSSIVSDNIIFSGVNVINTTGGIIVANESCLSNDSLEVQSTRNEVIFVPEFADFTRISDLPVHFISSVVNPCGDPQFEIVIEIISDYSGENISCNGSDDAEVRCVITGGVGPFTCEWFGGPSENNTGETYSGLGAGTYTVLVTDEGQGVTCVENVQITEPPPLALFALNLSSPTCADVDNGSAFPIILGGTGPYSFEYSNGVTTQVAIDLSEGENTLVISDINDCPLDTTFVLEVDSLDINLIHTDSLCFGDDIGIASVAPSGGGGEPYIIEWSTTEMTNSISNLSGGTYTVEITDADACSSDSTFTITELEEIIITLDDSESPVCANDPTGTISVSIIGGLPSYTFEWNKDGVPFSMEEDLIELEIGFYELSVTDAFGCIGEFSLSLESQEEIIVETSIVEIDCFENCFGSITATIIQAQAPIIFTWTDINGIISNASFIEDLCAGTYDLEVLDGRGCNYTETFIIEEPEEIVVFEDITDVTCNGLEDGFILLSVSGGTAPYSTDLLSVEINPGEFLIENLVAGDYSVDITDDSGCTVSVDLEVTEPDPLLINVDSEDPLCFGEDSGSVSLSISGGSEPYSVEWVELGVFDELNQSSLISGDYNIHIMDAEGCEEQITVSLEDPLEIGVMETINPVLCNGEDTGSIELEVSNAIGNLTVLWEGNVINVNDLNQFSLEAGTYEVTIIDENGCQFNSTYEVIESPEKEVTDTIVNPGCFDELGEISIEITGGQEPYDISWAEINAPDQLLIQDLPAGTYSATIIDANLCEVQVSYEITQPDQIIATTDVIQPNCVLLLGTIEILDLQGGTGDISTVWTGVNAPNEILVTDLDPGEYSVLITDDNDCLVEEFFTINEPGQLDVIETINPVSCFGGNNGSIELEITGAVEPLDVVWTGNVANTDETNQVDLISGTYAVDILDAEGCDFSATYEVIESEEIEIAELIIQPRCAGTFGSIEIAEITGGTDPYDFIWLELAAPDQNLIENLVPGDYTIQVTDANNCTAEETYNITEPGVLSVNPIVTNNSCFGGAEGSIELEVSNAVDPLTIAWVAEIPLDDNLIQADLPSGLYEITIVDADGCDFSSVFEVTSPDEIIITEDISVLNCSEDPGTIEILINGGEEPYNIFWTGADAPGETLLENLSAGNYNVTVIDANDCEVIEDYSITAPNEIEIVEIITQPSCFGDLGAVSVEITGGTGTYSIEWTGTDADGSTEILGLTAGTYTISVIDENGCEKEESYDINLINELAASVTITQPECFTLTGEATLAIEGGNEPYSVSWLGIAAENELIATDISPGSYIVEIEDANLCALAVEIEITEPFELTSETVIESVHCNGENTGSIDITLANTTGTVDYNWVNAESGFSSPVEDIENLFAGSYELTATDELGCVFNRTVEIQETDGLVISLDNIQNEICGGDAGGSIEVSLSGGTLEYQTDWNGAEFTSDDEDIFDLFPGDYTLNVSDENGCAISETFSVNSGALIEPNASALDSECSESTGSMSVNIDSDNIIQDISWFNDGALITDGLVTTIEDLPSGMYSVEITDDQGCSIAETILISDTDAALIDAEANGVGCFGNLEGSILITVTSGTEPYNLTWAGPVSIADNEYNPTGLPAGDYNTSITDAEGCNAFQEVIITSPDSLIINETITNVSCFGNEDGVIALELLGGTEPFIVDWIDSDVDLNELSDLAPGEYSVEITDANDCAVEGTYQITEEDILTLDISFTELLCANETVTDIDITITGGEEPYTFSWTGDIISTNEDLADVGPGTYAVIITDASNCTIEETSTITQSTEIIIEVTQTQPSCLLNDGSLTANTPGGTGLDYAFFWYSSGDTPALIGQEQTLEDAEAGSYYLEVFDSAGCFSTAEVNLSNDQGEVTAEITDILCAQDDSGAIEIEAIDLAEPLSFEWTGPNDYMNADEDIFDLVGGEYTVTITDNNGCQLIETYEVLSTDELEVGIDITNICFGETGTGAIDILVTGGVLPYTINWTGNGLVSDQTSITDLDEGCYTLEILDANNCAYTAELCVSSLDEINLNSTAIGNVCFADELGQIELEITGGDPDYAVEWLNSDAEFVSDQVVVTGLATGVYTANITDGSGCVASINASVTSNPEILVEVSETPIVCLEDENGAFEIIYSGGVGELILTWTGPNGFTSEDNQILSLGNGDYCYEVADAIGCSITECYALNDPESLSFGQTVSSINCFGANNGEILLDVSGGYTPYSAAWSLDDTLFSIDEDISDLASGEYTVILTDSMGCTLEDLFTISEPTELTVSLDNIVGATCSTSLDGAFEITAAGGTLDYGYSWILNGTEESIDEDPSELGVGDYQVVVTDANGCTIEIASVLLPAIGAVEVIVPEVVSWCYTEDLQLIEAISIIAESTEWTNPPSADVLSTTSSVLFQNEPGVYELVLTGTDGPCEVTDTVEVTIYALPLADAGEDQEAFFETEVTIGGDPTTDDINTVEWSSFDLLNANSLFNPSYFVVNDIETFVLTVTSPEGCISEDSTQVILYPEIDVHTGFTPNNDNINDVWVIGNHQNYPSIEVWVYNRWGEELFYSEGYNQPWDGTYNGDSLPIGTYYYVIEIKEPDLQRTIDGPVTILR